MVYEVFLKAIERHKEYFEKNDIPAIEEYKDEREYNSIIVFSGNLIDVYVWRHNEDSTEVTYSYSSMMNDSDNNKLLLKDTILEFSYSLKITDIDSFESIIEEGFRIFNELINIYENNRKYNQ